MPDLDGLFRKYQDKKIALYGISLETEKVLMRLGEKVHITGLLDGFRDSGVIYGKNILSLNEAVRKGTEVIVVIARPGSCRAIARRIGEICRRHEILLEDIRGRNLLENRKVVYEFPETREYTREVLYQKIELADVVSFDLFDTLVMREVLFPTDIAELVDAALKEKGIIISEFVSKRLAAEKILAQSGAPALEAIYTYMENRMAGIPVSPMEMAKLEWSIDYNVIVPRKEMCDVFEYCVNKGKSVYIVTDTFYRMEQIEKILDKCGIAKYQGLFVSCEFHMGKRQGLYAELRKIEDNKRYLHLGDDFEADSEMAGRWRMDTFHVSSGEEMLDAVGYLGMGTHIETLADRVKMGMFTARLFNSPFLFEQENRRLEICDAYYIGYLLCAPVITDFLFWFRDRVKEEEIVNIWFCARDGYLLQRMYKILVPDMDTVYFMTSRIAAIEAGVEREEDIVYVDSMKFSGTLKENLKVRFGLNADAISMTDEDEMEILRYAEEILSRAKEQRKRYRAYIDGLKVKEGDTAFFDFVAKGTTQMYVQRLVANHLKGLYFIQLEPEYMDGRGIDIESFYGTAEMCRNGIFDDYYVLETILTAPHPYVCGFDETGQALFAGETRGERELECIHNVQRGIEDYFRHYLKIVPKGLRKTNKVLDEIIMGLIHHLRVTDQNFLSLVVEDPFFNRRTDMEDLI